MARLAFGIPSLGLVCRLRHSTLPDAKGRCSTRHWTIRTARGRYDRVQVIFVHGRSSKHSVTRQDKQQRKGDKRVEATTPDSASGTASMARHRWSDGCSWHAPTAARSDSHLPSPRRPNDGLLVPSSGPTSRRGPMFALRKCVESCLRTRSLGPTGALQKLHRACLLRRSANLQTLSSSRLEQSLGALAIM